MSEEHFDEWLQLNPFIKKLPSVEQQVLYQELKSHAAVENPAKYTETHLEGGIETVLEDEGDDKIGSGD